MDLLGWEWKLAWMEKEQNQLWFLDLLLLLLLFYFIII